MKFKVGDRVKIKSIEELKKVKNLHPTVSTGMMKMANQTYKVTRIIDNKYYRLNDKSIYNWVDLFVEDTFKIEKEEDYYTWLARRNK